MFSSSGGCDFAGNQSRCHLLKGQGAYSKTDMDVLYVVLNPSEVRDVKALMAKIDPDAFISIIDVDEVISSDFKIRRRNYDK